jgi:hypothetical protein
MEIACRESRKGAAAWIVVSIPLACDVYNTALGAAKLFTRLHAGDPPAQVKPA